VSISDVHSELAIQALASGAIDLVRKPTALATDQLYELRSELVSKVAAAAQARVPDASAAMTSAPRLPQGELATKLVVIGTSTGGPQALTRLLSAIPQGFPVPIAIALHIPAGYTEALAARLDQLSAIHVVEAHDGLELKPGMAVIARGGSHLIIERAGADIRARTPHEPRHLLHTPSVDLLFQSAAQSFARDVLAVVLTGMGDDGCSGARALRERGAVILTEAETSCVIYGMPRAVFEAGLSNEAAPLDAMASRIVANLR
jgi:two-component system chemotaxis response regulator CheB